MLTSNQSSASRLSHLQRHCKVWFHYTRFLRLYIFVQSHSVIAIISSSHHIPCCSHIFCYHISSSHHVSGYWARTTSLYTCPVSCGCRINQLLLCRGVRHPSDDCPGYDTKQSDVEVPVMLELWGIWSTPSLPLLPGLLWPGVVALDKSPIYRLNTTKPWFEFTVFFHLNCVLMLNCIIWNKT